MVGHLHLQSMDDSLKGKNREGLLDSPDSGLPPSPSPPFCSLSPSLSESRSASCATPVDREHGVYRRDGREGKLVRHGPTFFLFFYFAFFLFSFHKLIKKKKIMKEAGGCVTRPCVLELVFQYEEI